MTDNLPPVIIISDDLRVKIGRASYAVYLSSLSSENTIMITVEEIKTLLAFLEQHMNDIGGG